MPAASTFWLAVITATQLSPKVRMLAAMAERKAYDQWWFRDTVYNGKRQYSPPDVTYWSWQ